MKTNKYKWISISAAVCLVAASHSFAAGLLKSKQATDESITIKDHQVNVVINNGFARTEVDQVFANSNTMDIEAIYTFPLPKQASLSELSLWINGNEVLGEVVGKEQARALYEQERAAGRDTALAEKNEYKTFDISIGRIPAGADTRVRLVYYQPLDIDLGIGRYLYPLEEGGVDDERIPFWSVDDKVSGTFSFDLTLKSAFPIKECRVPGFEQQATITTGSVDEEYDGDVYHITLRSTESANLSKDIVIYYRLDDATPARVELIPYKESSQDNGTFMVVVTPAADLKRIEEGTDWTFVLDISGSMSGGKICTLAEGVSRVIGKMAPNDRFRIVTFSDRASDVTHGYITATPKHVQEWITRIKGIKADGGTALHAGLKKGLRSIDDDRTSSIVLVTDGVCNIGPTQQDQFLDLLREYDVRLFTFVIGNSANQPLLDKLAKATGGFAMNISNQDDIYGRLIQAKAKVLHECLHDVELTFNGERVYDVTPAKPCNLYMGQQLVMFGHYRGAGPLTVELKGRISGKPQSWTCTVDLPDVDQDNPEIERLWALSKIESVMQDIHERGEQKSWVQEVKDLGVSYSLVTDYTSMIVVQDDVFENEGIDRRNADRVHRERQAQQRRETLSIRNNRVDNQGQNPSGGAFGGRSAPSLGNGGTGPVGPLFLALILFVKRMKKQGANG